MKTFEQFFYPEVHRLIQDAWKHHEQIKGKLTVNRVSQETGIAGSSIHKLKEGRQKPRRETIQALADFFCEDTTTRAKFKESLTQATQAAPEPVSTGDRWSAIVAGDELKVGVVNYNAFSATENDGFLNRLFDRFTAFAALRRDTPFTAVTLNDAIDKIDRKEFDVILGVLNTPDRAKRVKCIALPITIPVNGVVLTKHLGAGKCQLQKREIRDALLKNITEPQSKIVPIINEMEVGGLHVINFLRLKSTDYESIAFGQDAYIKKLTSMKSEKVPVAVADEVTCTGVIQALRKGACDLVFDSFSPEFHMPRYRLGFLVSRQQAKLADYLSEAFETFLESNSTLVAEMYVRLYRKLSEETKSIGANARKLILEWLGFSRRKGKAPALSLNTERLVLSPWHGILLDALQRINSTIK